MYRPQIIPSGAGADLWRCRVPRHMLFNSFAAYNVVSPLAVLRSMNSDSIGICILCLICVPLDFPRAAY